MKYEIKERVELLKHIVDEYTRGVSEFSKYPSPDDYGGYDIPISSGASKYQLHEMAKMLRREILKIDKAIMNYDCNNDKKLGR